MSGRSRRALLRAVGGTAGTLAAVGVAGCNSIPFLGGDGGGYRRWLYEPGTVSERDHYSFSYLRPGPVVDNEASFSAETLSSLRNIVGLSDFRETIDLDFEETDSVLLFSPSGVVAGDYSVPDVEDALADAGFDPDDEVGPYEVWVDERRNRAVGLGGSRIVTGAATDRADAPEVVEAAVGARRGNEDRYVGENDDFRLLTGRLGSGHLVSGRTFEAGTTTPFESQVARGDRFEFRGSTTRVRRVGVFEAADAFDVEEVRDVVASQRGASGGVLGSADSVDVGKRGRTVVIDVELPTGEL